ncbi:DUF4231 domain-containing protein [Tardiphaga sp. 1201_B9_N1_1]|uniref:DUF4231 domain-containing protein n=1 Tax=unclassified Tardiphaga TaxID=2631404 RepID=UPI003F23D396
MFKSMDAEAYISERVEQYSGWYDKKAVRAKSAYLRIRVVSAVSALIVPILANLNFGDYDRFKTPSITLVSLIVSVAVALDSIYHFGDQWKNYRSSEQFLRREKFLFRTGEGPYKEFNSQDAFILFIERCEAQISAENAATLNVIESAAQPVANSQNPKIS